MNGYREKAEDVFVDMVGLVAGGLVGLLASLYGRYAAEAAVKVRPALADVGFLDAVLTNHGHDWLFYHYPNVMTAITVLFAAVVIGVGWNSVGR